MIRWILISLALLLAACGTAPTATPTPTATELPTSTVTSSPPAPSETPTASPTATLTLTPSITPTATATLPPTTTPGPNPGFTFDNWVSVALPDSILDGIDNPLIAFLNVNDRDGIGDIRTPQVFTNIQTLYYVSPSNPGGRIPMLQMPATTRNQVYLSASGSAIAYFIQDPGNLTSGLYILDAAAGISGRILNIPSLVQRGIFSTPVWSSDGERLAIALATAYDVDIFTVNRDGSNWQNVTNLGSYERWPSWSPDGTRLIFVSDRTICPSWIPGDTNTCDSTNIPPPNGGNVYMLDTASSQLTQLSTLWVTEPPRWINNRQVAFSSGNPALGEPERTLWLVDVQTGQSREVRINGVQGNQINLSEVWSPDGSRVVFQNASSGTELTMMTSDGSVVGTAPDLAFVRYGVSIAWSPNSNLIAVGGINAQCPYGITVLNADFGYLSRAAAPPGMCDPVFSPTGELLAFTGVNTRGDGRVDVYVANNNGFGAGNLTADLRGEIDLLGWVGR